MPIYELDHWVLFDSMSKDQIDRLKKVIDSRVEPAERASFGSILDEEIEKLDRP